MDLKKDMQQLIIAELEKFGIDYSSNDELNLLLKKFFNLRMKLISMNKRYLGSNKPEKFLSIFPHKRFFRRS